ncbi:putative FBD-associated F-box protein [Arabidopsis thaliana]
MKRNDIVCWNQPSSFGRPQDRDIAVYILKNACHLKTATFLTDKRINDVRRLKMIKELRLSPRASSTCQLVFGEDF